MPTDALCWRREGPWEPVVEDNMIVRLQTDSQRRFTAIAEVTVRGVRTDEGTVFVFVGKGFSDDMRRAVDDATGEAWSMVQEYREEAH